MIYIGHVAEQEPYDLHRLGYVSWIASVPYRSCTASHNSVLGYGPDGLLQVVT